MGLGRATGVLGTLGKFFYELHLPLMAYYLTGTKIFYPSKGGDESIDETAGQSLIINLPHLEWPEKKASIEKLSRSGWLVGMPLGDCLDC